jgi:hypothetical protein
VIDTAMAAAMISSHPGLKDVLVGVEPVARMGKPIEIAEAVT